MFVGVCLEGPILCVLTYVPLLFEGAQFCYAVLNNAPCLLCLPEVPICSALTNAPLLPISSCNSESFFLSLLVESISSPSVLLSHKFLIKTVQVHLTCNKELDRFCVGFKDPKVRKQSNLDYSVLKYVFS